jgi:hypothetical protein
MHNVHRGGHFENATRMTIYSPFGSGHSLKIISTIGERNESRGGEKFENKEKACFHSSI